MWKMLHGFFFFLIKDASWFIKVCEYDQLQFFKHVKSKFKKFDGSSI